MLNPFPKQADVLINYFDSQSFESMKRQFITHDSEQSCLHEYEPKCFEDLATHFRHLSQEFDGESELSFYHAVVIILLRRGDDTTSNFERFEQLWQTQADYLLQTLSIRWLVSACDTFVDYCDNPLRQAILMNGVSVVNTLKVYETTLDLHASQPMPVAENIQQHYAKHQQLYDGLTYFRAGTDDSLYQMLRRYANFESHDPFAYHLLMTIFRRLEAQPSGFALMRELHLNKDHLW